MTEEHFEIYV